MIFWATNYKAGYPSLHLLQAKSLLRTEKTGSNAGKQDRTTGKWFLFRLCIYNVESLTRDTY